MSLVPGARVGPYDVISRIGAGGMGEVFKARDTRLGRDVAIKVLPASFASDADRRARFDREARAVAALSHPNILAVHDVGETGGAPSSVYMVTELLEGESLRDRLKGPEVGTAPVAASAQLPVRKAVDIAIQIARGLAAAHAKGIVHRDLKPENVFVLHDGQVKILDFGLARQTTEGSGATETAAVITDPGVVMGTAGYMAPEQVRGQTTDARTDLFALGAVLYEMLSGRRAFRGDTAADTMSAILSADPPELSSIRGETSPALDRIVRHCLEKNPAERFQTARDVAFALEALSDAATSSPQSLPASPPRRGLRERWLWIVACAALGGLLVASIMHGGFRTPPSSPRLRLSTAPIDNRYPEEFALSPDGRWLAYVTTSRPGAPTQLWLRPMDDETPRAVSGSDGARTPFWSPDSRSVAFRATGGLKKLDVATGSLELICALQFSFGGEGTWSDRGIIIFDVNGMLMRVPASGGTPAAVFPSRQAGAPTQVAETSPSFLPGGQHFLYSRWRTQVQAAISVGSLDGGSEVELLSNPSEAVFAEGYLLYTRDAALVAQPFDLDHLRLAGDPVRLVDAVQGFSVARTGLLAYRPGKPSDYMATIEWFNRAGTQAGTVSQSGQFWQIRLSPDGATAAVNLFDTTFFPSVWTLDLATHALSRFTFETTSQSADPVWAPDGKSIAFISDRNRKLDFFRRDIGGKADDMLFESPSTPKYLDDWSRDNKFILFHDEKDGIFALPLTGERKPFKFSQTPGPKDSAHFSPDSHWVAYESMESGTNEVYVAAFPAFDHRRQISVSGGVQPIWRADGRELFYLDPSGNLMAVAMNPGAPAGAPAVLFRSPNLSPAAGLDQYAVARDGQRFLFIVLTKPADAAPTPITVLLNWAPGSVR